MAARGEPRGAGPIGLLCCPQQLELRLALPAQRARGGTCVAVAASAEPGRAGGHLAAGHAIAVQGFFRLWNGPRMRARAHALFFLMLLPACVCLLFFFLHGGESLPRCVLQGGSIGDGTGVAQWASCRAQAVAWFVCDVFQAEHSAMCPTRLPHSACMLVGQCAPPQARMRAAQLHCSCARGAARAAPAPG